MDTHGAVVEHILYATFLIGAVGLFVAVGFITMAVVLLYRLFA
jgi:hypothetical protein